MTALDGHQVDGADGVYVISSRATGALVGTFYCLDDEPGWWRGIVHGRVRRLFLPLHEPVDVAARFLHPEPPTRPT